MCARIQGAPHTDPPFTLAHASFRRGAAFVEHQLRLWSKSSSFKTRRNGQKFPCALIKIRQPFLGRMLAPPPLSFIWTKCCAECTSGCSWIHSKRKMGWVAEVTLDQLLGPKLKPWIRWSHPKPLTQPWICPCRETHPKEGFASKRKQHVCVLCVYVHGGLCGRIASICIYLAHDTFFFFAQAIVAPRRSISGRAPANTQRAPSVRMVS